MHATIYCMGCGAIIPFLRYSRLLSLPAFLEADVFASGRIRI